MDLDMAMDMMNHEQLLHTISQLDRTLTYLSSPSASPPPHPPVPVPSIPPPVTMPVLPPVALNPVRTGHTATRQLVGIEAADAARPRRRNVRVSSEPQSVAARLRRERVSQRMRALQRLVPGGARLDTASMLDEAIRYVTFLKSHVQALERTAAAAAAHGLVVDHDVLAGAARDFYSCPYYA